jgi:hypothetical protein
MAYKHSKPFYHKNKVDNNLTEDPACYSYHLRQNLAVIEGLYHNPQVSLAYYKTEVVHIVEKALTKQEAYHRFIFNIKTSFSKKEVYDFCLRAMNLGEKITSGNLVKPAAKLRKT